MAIMRHSNDDKNSLSVDFIIENCVNRRPAHGDLFDTMIRAVLREATTQFRLRSECCGNLPSDTATSLPSASGFFRAIDRHEEANAALRRDEG
jgi:hypothetical protein